MNTVQRLRIHEYSDIDSRTKGIADFPDDFHLYRHEDLGSYDIVLHLGENHLFSAWRSDHFDRMRIDWSPNPNLRKEDLTRKLLEHYSQLVTENILGRPRITADIQTSYKHHGKEIAFSAQDIEKGLTDIMQYHAFEYFVGLVLSGCKKSGKSTIIGLDMPAISEAWNHEYGRIFVETDMDLQNWLPNFYLATSPFANDMFRDAMPQLLQICEKNE